MRKIGLLLLLLPLPAAAYAQDDPCADAESTVAINECLREIYRQADAELNRVYQGALKHIDAADYMPARTRQDWKQKLREAQRHWVAFKEADCNLLYLEWWQGSGANAAALGCLIGKTETRTTELKERYAIE